jgi:hypothetical protein
MSHWTKDFSCIMLHIRGKTYSRRSWRQSWLNVTRICPYLPLLTRLEILVTSASMLCRRVPAVRRAACGGRERSSVEQNQRGFPVCVQAPLSWGRLVLQGRWWHVSVTVLSGHSVLDVSNGSREVHKELWWWKETRFGIVREPRHIVTCKQCFISVGFVLFVCFAAWLLEESGKGLHIGIRQRHWGCIRCIGEAADQGFQCGSDTLPGSS